MPEAQRKIFLAVFRRLPQRVLWKWEDESGMEDLPPNGLNSISLSLSLLCKVANNIFLSSLVVRLYTWLPPIPDLLAHPKMKLLMTHGGLYSNQETVWAKIPLIGLPVFGDQVIHFKRKFDQGRTHT